MLADWLMHSIDWEGNSVPLSKESTDLDEASVVDSDLDFWKLESLSMIRYEVRMC